MPAINLDSLNVFWQSVKAFFAGNIFRTTDETVLYEDPNGQGDTTIQLSSPLTSGKSYRVTFVTNDSAGYTQTFRWGADNTSRIILIAGHNNMSGTARSYIKISRWSVSADLKTLTLVNASQTNLNASSLSTSRNMSTFKIVKVVETTI